MIYYLNNFKSTTIMKTNGKTEMTQFVIKGHVNLSSLIIFYHYYRTTDTVADREVDFFFLAVPPGRMLDLKKVQRFNHFFLLSLPYSPLPK